MTMTPDFAVVGTPIAVDTAPNTSAPAADRVFRSQRYSGKLLLWLKDGTSATVSVWAKDSDDNWVLIEAGISIAAPLTAVTTTNDAPQDSTLFIQVTAAAGNPTSLYGRAYRIGY